MRQLSKGPGRERKTFPLTIRTTRRAYSVVDNAVRSDKCEDIYRFRKAFGLSRPEFGRLLGVSWLAIYNWEHGKRDPQRLAWNAFLRVRTAYRRKMKRLGKDLDGGPVMEEK